MGAAHTQLLRQLPSDYSDGISSLAGEQRLNAREISNIISSQLIVMPSNELGASDYLWQWGQFLDHDIDLSDGAEPPEPAPIVVPNDDEFFTPDDIIPFNRSIYDPTTGVTSPRQQINEITAWIDASNVYGSDVNRAMALRKLDGSGQLKMSAGRLLPFNKAGLPNAGGSSDKLFLAGDVRANEQVGLIAMHTLFVREHNRLARKLSKRHPHWKGERIYQEARQYVGALMQVITCKEFLPALLGDNVLSPYKGYKPNVNGGIRNSFSTAVYRFGHSALSPILLRLDAQGHTIPEGNLPLRDAFFAPHLIINEGGISPILRGLARQKCQKVDCFLIDDVRNFLFGQPGSGGFDLAALNVQRGRDHGLPSYNEVRIAMEMQPVSDFTDITNNPELLQRLEQAYVTVDDIDLWVGGLAETSLKNSHLGELFTKMIAKQFEVLRDADRFWYQRIFRGKKLKNLETTTLADIIRRNTKIRKNNLQENVFKISTTPLK